MTDKLVKIEDLLDNIDSLSLTDKLSEAEKLFERKDKIINEMQTIKDEKQYRKQVHNVFSSMMTDFGSIIGGIKSEVEGIKINKNEAKYEITTSIAQINKAINRNQLAVK